jgi:site-specific DNA-cytosine methylase
LGRIVWIDMMKKIKYISLFAGIGGFEQGIIGSGIPATCSGFSEVDKYAKQVYDIHYSHSYLGDATKIRTESLPNYDLLVAGFPCQAFSYAGYQKGFCDTRGTLFFEIARILRDTRPKNFLLENVAGLLSHQSGRTFQEMLKILTEMGYDVQWQVLNSRDFGFPQNRKRVFIVGYLGKRHRRQIFPLRTEAERAHTNVEQGNKNGFGFTIDKRNPDGVIKQEVANCVDHNYYKGPDKHSQRTMVYQNGKVRKLTPEECEMLQGFYPTWTAIGVNKYGSVPLSPTRRYMLIGNSVNPHIVSRIVKLIYDEK